MEKVLKKIPGAEDAPKANLIMEINIDHAIANKLKSLYKEDKDELKKYCEILFAQSCIIAGISTEDTGRFCQLITDLMIK